MPESVLQPVFDPAGNLYFDSRDPSSAYHTLTRLDPEGKVDPQGQCCRRASIGTVTAASAPGLPAGLVLVRVPALASNKELIIGLNMALGAAGGGTSGAIWVASGN